jgi:hypothetical protein
VYTPEGKLKIFENVVIDYRLPKYQKPTPGVIDLRNQSPDLVISNETDDDMQRRAMLGAIRVQNSPRFFVSNDGESMAMRRRTLKETISDFITRVKQPRRTMSVQDFFKSVKNSQQELQVLKELAIGYEQAVKKAHDAGQLALEEQLKDMLAGVRSEAQLIAMGRKKYLEEAQVVDFAKRSKRGLRLDWIVNFTRMIPDDVLKVKRECDERLIFDNYVVLHYDPKAKAFSETKEEKERKKDPVLFGVLVGRRRLYYVGDWVDEFCDLTFDKIAETLGAQSIKELNTEQLVKPDPS